MTARYDAIGIGFGPSNLALAIALEERGDTGRMRFFERQECFGWHRDMLLPDATLQVNHLKDLVTLRDPRSSFSFVNYLHEQGRLIDDINLKTSFPTRLEFHDYLQWAAARVAPVCDYGAEVVGVRPVGDGDRVDALAVDIVRGGVRESVETDSIVVENVSRVERVVDATDGVTLTIRDQSRGTSRELQVDAVVFAAGYEPVSVDDLLPALAGRFARDERGRVIVERDYRLRTDDAFAPAVYLQGGTEHTHGLTSSLLSAVAVRAGEIAEPLDARRVRGHRGALAGALVGNGVS